MTRLIAHEGRNLANGEEWRPVCADKKYNASTTTRAITSGRIRRSRIAEDVLVDVAGYVYPMDFVILDIKEDKQRPFILGTPFLTIYKAVIKFDKGMITLRSGKSKISFHKIPETRCRIKKGTKNDIDLIAPTMTINRLVLEWAERIKLHQEKEMKFDQ
ncbi:reverse transcriptase domain-containing protein [Tanacetum coccineum]